MKKQKKAKQALYVKPLLILSAIIFGTALWYARPRPVPVGINLIGSASGTVNLSFTPNPLITTVGSSNSLLLNINAGTSHVSIVQIEMTYDQSKLGTPTVVLSQFLPNIIVPLQVGSGKISFTVAAPPSSGGVTGGGTLATLTFNPVQVGDTSLSFTDKTEAWVVESTTNALKAANSGAVNVIAPPARPTPSTSANPTVTASPSLSPSPSPSPSAPAAEKPAKPTSLRSNCYDNGNKITLRWDAVSGVDSYKVRIDQKDGNNDKSNDGVNSTEYNYDIISGQKYSWWVHSSKNGADSDEAKVNEVICEKSSPSTATPTPTATPTAPAKATATPKSTTTTKATTTPTASSTTQYVVKQNTGSLNDIFADPDSVAEIEDGQSTTKLTFWQKLVKWITDIFNPNENE
jgi:hypothetical protein